MSHRFLYLGVIVYFVLITFILLQHNLWFSPDQFVIFGLVIAVLLGRGKKFLADWIPFIIMFLSYEALHGINPDYTKVPINIQNVIDTEKWLFGQIPTITLQQLFFDAKKISLPDIFFSIIYTSHFIGFLFFSFALWFRKHRFFHQFTYTIILLSFSAFLTYIIFPVMPPWMAGEQGYLPKIQRIMYQTTPIYTQPTADVPTVYKYFAANKYAAIPSLHAAYPFVIFLFAILLKRKWLIALTGIYTLCVWFAVVYLGEHYVIDIFAGVLYSLGAFLIIRRLSHRSASNVTMKH